MQISNLLPVAPLAAAELISAAAATFLWTRRPADGAAQLSILSAVVALWIGGVFFQVTTPDFHTNYLLVKITYFAIMAVPVCWFLFCSHYSGSGAAWKPWRIFLLSLPPAVCAILSATNFHQVFRNQEHMARLGSLYVISNGRGPAWYVAVAYAYLLMLAGMVILIGKTSRGGRVFRLQTATVVVAGILPWIANFLFLIHLSPFGDLDPAPFAFTATGTLLAGALFRFRLFDVVPIARGLVLENMPDCLLVMDSQNRLVDLNAAAARIIGSRARVGSAIAEALSPWPQLLHHIQAGESRSELLLGDAWWDVTLTPLRNPEGRPSGTVAVLRDVTQNKRARETMGEAMRGFEQAARAKSEFLATMSHELRTPLNGIIGMSELLADTSLNREQREFLDDIQTSGASLLELIQSVLDFSKLEAGKISLEAFEFDIEATIQEFTAPLYFAARQKGLAVSTTYAPDLPALILGDPQRLSQILLNLVSNAIKFTEHGSVRIDVAWRPTEPRVGLFCFSVQDTGIGISADQQASLFAPFTQGDSSTTRRFGGAGLGLAISRQLVELMGGQIGVRSQLAQGSTFWVELPMALLQN